MNDGTKTLYQGMKVLNDNSDALLAAPDMMVEGLTQLKGGLSLVPSENQVKQLTDGSSAILTTLSKLSDGATAVDQGVETLKTTIHGLKEKAYSNESLNKYASMMEKNPTLVKLLLGALNEDQKTEIILGLLGVYSATNTVLDGATTSVEGMQTLSSGVSQGMTSLNEKYGVFDQGIQSMSALPQAVQKMGQGIDGMIGVIQEQKVGMTTYVNGVQTAYQGSVALYSGTQELKNGTTTLNQGAQKLTSGIHELYNGSSKLSQAGTPLKDGTFALMTGLNQLDQTSTPLLMGMNTLCQGVQKLDDIKTDLLKGAQAIKDGNSGVKDAMNGLYEVIKTLKKGTHQLYSTVGGKKK